VIRIPRGWFAQFPDDLAPGVVEGFEVLPIAFDGQFDFEFFPNRNEFPNGFFPIPEYLQGKVASPFSHLSGKKRIATRRLISLLERIGGSLALSFFREFLTEFGTVRSLLKILWKADDVYLIHEAWPFVFDARVRPKWNAQRFQGLGDQEIGPKANAADCDDAARAAAVPDLVCGGDLAGGLSYRRRYAAVVPAGIGLSICSRSASRGCSGWITR
jgi:hypothetical protein